MKNLSIGELKAKLIHHNATWLAKETHISLRSDEVKKRMLGRTEPHRSVEFPTMLFEAGATLPDFDQEVDWRNKKGVNHITSVKNQESSQACVSFCTVGVTESMAHIEKNIWLDLSEADQHYCSSHGAINSGWNDAEAFDQIKSRGVCDEASFMFENAFPNNDPKYYFANPEPPHPICRMVPDRKSKAVKITTVSNFGSNQAHIKNHLTYKGPVSATLAVYNDFFSYSSGIYHNISGTLTGYHCIMVVGYSEANQCWICKNSWGSTWGMDGYFNIAYGQCEIDDNEKIGISGVILPNQHKGIDKAKLSKMLQ
jgi:C1A family cysteine protease